MLLGRYELKEKLAAGGMGEIFRATVAGAEGFKKTVAIKRIYPDLAQDEGYRALFVREAKLVAHLAHPNIAQVFELGENEDELYIVMELIRGVDVGRILGELHQAGQTMTPPLVATLAFDVLNALDYAHRQTDRNGRTLNVVHRDVSPQNIMVSSEGFAKLCDFGVARIDHAPSRASHLGKFLVKRTYAAPEQLMGQPADARSDLFGLGVVLCELLTARPLFVDEDPPTQLRMLNDGIIDPLRDGSPERWPPGLAMCLRRMVSLDPNARFASAAQARALVEDYLVTASPSTARAALAELVQKLRPPGTAPESLDDQVSQAEGRWTALVTRAGAVAGPVSATQSLVGAETPWEADAEVEHTSVTPRVTVPDQKRAPRVRTVVGLVALLAVVAGYFVWTRILFPPLLDFAGITLEPMPPAVLSRGKVAPASGSPATGSEAEGTTDATDRRAPPARKRPVARDADKGAQTGYLNLNARPWAKVTINGQKLGKTTPLLNYPLPPGDHEVRLEGSDGRVRQVRITIKANQTTNRFVE